MSFSMKGPLPFFRTEQAVQMAKDARHDWHLIDWSFHAVEPAGAPAFDPDIVKAIRETDPDFLPLVARSVWRAPTGEERTYFHHALAFQSQHPAMQESSLLVRRVTWPSTPGHVNYGRESRGAVLWQTTLEGPQDHLILPGETRALSWPLVKEIQAAMHTYRNASGKPEDDSHFKALLAKEEAKEKAREAMEAEIDYRIDHDAGKQFRDAALATPDHEWRALAEQQQAQRAALEKRGAA